MASLEELFAAVQADDADSVREIIARQPGLARERTDTGRSAVLLATYFGASAALAALLESAPALDACEAAAVGDAERLRVLAAEGAPQLRALGADGATPLHFAAFLGHPDCIRLLLEAEVPLDTLSTNENRNTPLHAALAGRAGIESVTELLDAGAPLEAVGAGGYTPLHIAASRGDVAIIRLLVERGAVTDAVMDDGKNAADVAADRDHDQAAAYLASLDSD